MAVGEIGLPDHSNLADGLSSPGGSGCGLSPPAICLVCSGVKTAGCGNFDGSPLWSIEDTLSILASSQRDAAVNRVHESARKRRLGNLIPTMRPLCV